jgi:GntR family transcriptional repressor for pyruvate dehydrogenase complex
MEYTKVKPLKGYELVMQHIKEQILSGDLPPGKKLASVVDLASHFGVGRSTVREALSALKAMGWLDIQQGGGTYVKKILPKETSAVDLFQTAESLKEILEVRKILESSCAALAAEQRSEKDLIELKRILKKMSDCINDEEKGEQTDVLFHLQIAKASGNSLLLQLMESLSQRMQETMKDSRKLWFYGERSTALRLLKEHQGIYDAIEKQDKAKANNLMLQHIVKVESVLFIQHTSRI